MELLASTLSLSALRLAPQQDSTSQRRASCDEIDLSGYTLETGHVIVMEKADIGRENNLYIYKNCRVLLSLRNSGSWLL